MLHRRQWRSYGLSLLTLIAVIVGAASADDDPSSEAEMSAISGPAEKPRRHFRLKNPRRVSPERAAHIYGLVASALANGYAESERADIAGYQGWPRYNSAPYLSATHGNHYVNNYANDDAEAYGLFEKAGTLPVGSVIAKDSFSITSTGGILLGPLFVMQKMPSGFNSGAGDWKYVMIQPDGDVLGETGGHQSEAVEYCIACHLAVEDQDHLFLVPPPFRAYPPERVR